MLVKPKTTVEKLIRVACEFWKLPGKVVQYRLILSGAKLHYEKTMEQLEIKENDKFFLFEEQIGGKPVIYLFPPIKTSDIEVELTLISNWAFSAVYPVVPITAVEVPPAGSSVKWIVTANPDGSLYDPSAGLALSYLFWEATSISITPNYLLVLDENSPNTFSSLPFDPSHPTVNPFESLLLPFSDFIPYLDGTLSKLTLHVSARNDIITYWLPHFVRIRERGQQIAFRFLPQAEYEQAAKLQISPKPDVVTRVFMVFKGVKENEWNFYTQKLEDVCWRSVVGVSEHTRDSTKFRCLEWGGMEAW
ncbi:hypothetical protein T439DRAFT_283262 [Meredithblackwellia eburnea MCA 4105]